MKVIHDIPDNVVEAFIKYEDGDMGEAETIEFFQMLIDTGLDKQLQGKYEQTAKQLIMANSCHKTITVKAA